MDRADIRHFFLVLGAFTITLSLFCYVTGGSNEFRDGDAVDFAALRGDEVIVDMALTRRQVGLLMTGYLERYGNRPQVGVFGNHQIQLYSSEAFGKPKNSNFFFNYWFSNLALPELRDQLYYLATKDLLPRKLAIVHITSPNNDNGRHIVKYGRELPTDMRKLSEAAYATNTSQVLRAHYTHLRSALEYRLDYANLFRSLNRGNKVWIRSPASCADGHADAPLPAFVRIFPEGVQRFAGFFAEHAVCERLNWSITRDGAAHPLRVAAVREPLQLNANPLLAHYAGLSFGDEKVIASHMRQIADIGREQGISVVFVIMPVYETPDRSDSKVNQIMDRALAQLSGVQVIDHRRMYLPAAYFSNYDHPNNRYFGEILSPEICAKYHDAC